MTSDDNASAALLAVARLLSAPNGDIRAAAVDEARALIGATAATLVAADDADRPAQAFAIAADASPRLAAHLDAPVTSLLIVPAALRRAGAAARR